jgi:hypothetical protein
VYDETENFRDYDHELFDYPYEDRKTKLTSVTLNIRDSMLTMPDENDKYPSGFQMKTDYEYSS